MLLSIPQIGHTQSAGMSSKAVPGAMPCSGSPFPDHKCSRKDCKNTFSLFNSPFSIRYYHCGILIALNQNISLRDLLMPRRALPHFLALYVQYRGTGTGKTMDIVAFARICVKGRG